MVVSNSSGSTSSASARLTVNVPVQFLTQPASQTTVVKGRTLTLSVTTSGTQPITYQWQRDGVNVPRATAATLTVPNVQLSDAGSYLVVASNVVNVTTSSLSDLGMILLSERVPSLGSDWKGHFRWRVDGVDLSSSGPDS